jgi:hypothetical protein
MKQTAVELLKQRLIKDQQVFPIYNEYINGILYDINNELLEMENQQKDKFAIDFYNWICSEEAVDLIQDLQIVGELSKIVTTKELLEIFKKK